MTRIEEPARTIDRRHATAFVVAVVAGIGIALIDSSPGWDSTGITAGLFVAGIGLRRGRRRDRLGGRPRGSLTDKGPLTIASARD